MKLAASRQLDGYPADLATVAEDVVVHVLRERVAFLEAYDACLVPKWSQRLEASAVALLTVDGTPWVLDAEGAWACGGGGECLARVPARPHEGMQLAAFGPVSDGFVFAWEPDLGPRMSPILERVDFDGTIRWSGALPVGSADYESVVRMIVSGDAVLVCCSDMASTGIGAGHVTSLADGSLRFTTQRGPISEVASLDGGAFLVGYQGYGAFETLRYDRDGGVSERWASHGHYVIGDGVRVIELKNVLPSNMHLARLLPGGAVTKGEWLDGYCTSKPLLGVNGTTYFFRKGAVLAARDLSIDERLPVTKPDDGLFSTAIVGDERGFYFAYTQMPERSASLVRIDL